MNRTSPAISVPRAVCNDPGPALHREWLVTNGLGGFAMGTVAGGLTRRYHGLLIAALDPPLGRTLMAVKLDETVHLGELQFPLCTNVWKDGIEEPAGCRRIERFVLAAGVPTWEFGCGAARLTKRIGMEYGRNTTCVEYELGSASPPVALECRLLVNHRDYHALTPGDARRFEVACVGVSDRQPGLRITPPGTARPLVALCERVDAPAAVPPAWTPRHDWFRDFTLPFEASVGYDDREDHLLAGVCRVELAAGQSVRFTLSAEPDALGVPPATRAAPLRGAAARAAAVQAAAAKRWSTPPDRTPAELHQLVLAADQFIVRRPLPGDPDGRTVIAGYPWFTDWGRDAMISLPGLTLCTGRDDIARQILQTWARVVDQGMIPNRFPDAGDTPEYNTADATLWYLWAIGQYHTATADRETLRELFPVMAEIVAWHRRGTRYNIRVDADGLLYAGQPGVNLTWMDAKVGDWVVTPRIGKPIELSALWYDGLRNLVRMASGLGRPGDEYAALADRTAASFGRFWNAERGCCYDVIDGPPGAVHDGAGRDARIQANQVFAVSLDHSPLPAVQQAAVVETLKRALLTPFGLRTLAPGEPRYHGRYEGRLPERDAAYHQGTAWGWLLGPFVIAHYRVHRDAAAARRLLEPMLMHVSDHGVGSIAEIFDGDPPHTPRGCPAQAWSVAETLRAWQVTQGE